MHDLTELGLFAAAIVVAPFAMLVIEAAERWRERWRREPEECPCSLGEDQDAEFCVRCDRYMELGGSE